MADGFPKGRVVAHKEIPYNHQYREPTPRAVALDKHHIERGNEIEGHDGGHEPERKVINAPKAPAYQNVGYEMEQIGTVAAAIGPVLGNIVKAGHDEPGGVEAEEAAVVEIECK